jgi:holin-like protein
MLVCLKTGLIRIEHVDKAGAFLLEIMPLLFIPAAVGLLTAWEALQSMLLPIIVLILVVTVIVMAVTGKTAQLMLRKDDDK